MRDTVGEWQALSALYEQADTLAPEPLRAWLDELERGRHHQLPALRRMLAARDHVAGVDFLESLPGRRQVARGGADSTRAPGSRFGAYRLLQWIGAGGMAEVWLAERADGAFARQVAVKLLHAHGHWHGESVAARFRGERDILASLHHPNIASLHDAGVGQDGQPWLALEYVEGVAIDTWCDGRRLSVDGRLALFADVLCAVEYAHANLVIHRDLKPANILVNGDGQPKILDFGIAKLVGASDTSVTDGPLTREFGRPLTPQYASPEQMSGAPLGTPSDVYALGLVLYELLCGNRPYSLAGLSLGRAEQVVNGTDPQQPSRCIVGEAGKAAAATRSASLAALRRSLAGDLDAVVLKALSQHPTQRYGSAAALRDDLDRVRRGDPVRAQRQTRWYRVQRFVGRHRLGVGVAAATSVTLAATACFAVLSAVDARRESSRATAAKDFLVEIYRVTDPDRAPGGAVDATRLLANGAQEALATLESQPKLQADVLASIGLAQSTADDFVGADRTLRNAERILRMLGDRRGLAAVEADLAANALMMNEADRATETARAAVVDAAPFSNDDLLQIKVLTTSGRAALIGRRFAQARSDLEAALHLAERRLPPADTRTVDLLRDLSDLSEKDRRLDAARDYLDRADEALARVAPHRKRDRLGVAMDRALLEDDLGRLDVAARILRDISPRCEADFGADSVDCANVRITQANVAWRMDDRAEGSRLLPALLRQVDRLESPRLQAGSVLAAGRWFAREGRAAEFAPLADRLRSLAADSQQQAAYRSSAELVLALAAIEGGQPHDGLAAARRALDVQLALPNPSLLWTGRARLVTGIARQRLEQWAQAQSSFDEADRDLRSALGEAHASLALSRLQALPTLRAAGRDQAAEGLCRVALPVVESSMGASAPMAISARSACVVRRSDSGASHRPAIPAVF